MKLKVKVGKISFQEGGFSAIVGIVDDKGCYISASQVITTEKWESIKESYPIIEKYSLERLLTFQVNASSAEFFEEAIKRILNLTHLLRLSDFDNQQALRKLHCNIKYLLGDDYYKESKQL